METPQRHALETAPLDPVAAPARSPARTAASNALHPLVYHPSTLLRRLLVDRASRLAGGAVAQQSQRELPDVPAASSVFGAALAVGAASGFLEMAVQAIQLRVFHRVDWTSLMFNRHAGWMLILVSASISALLSIALLDPVFLWAACEGGVAVPQARDGRGISPERYSVRCSSSAHSRRFTGLPLGSPSPSRSVQESSPGGCWFAAPGPGSGTVVTWALR